MEADQYQSPTRGEGEGSTPGSRLSFSSFVHTFADDMLVLVEGSKTCDVVAYIYIFSSFYFYFFYFNLILI